MPAVVHYELYVLEANGWSLRQRFASSERDEAVSEARDLENRTGQATKVVRETYNTNGLGSAEEVVYLSPRLKEGRPGQWIGGPAPTAAGTASTGARPNAQIPEGLEIYSDPEALRARAVNASTADILGRVLLVLSASLILASLSTALVPALLNLISSLGFTVAQGNLGSLLFGLFLAIFLICTAVIGRRLIPFASLLRGDEKLRRRLDDGPRAMPVPATAEDARLPKTTAAHWPEGQVDPVSLMEEEPGPPPVLETETARERARREKAEQREREEAAQREAEAREAARREAAARKESTQAAPAPTLSPEQEQGRRLAMAFLGGAVGILKGTRPPLDVFARFGLNLYLAGGIDMLGQRLGLGPLALRPLLRETLEVMGTRAALAQMFMDKLDEYALEPRYMRMMSQGREAMGHLLTQDADPFRDLPATMAEWSAPPTHSASSSTVAIVFTDIVESTALNSRVGDAVSRGVTRIHNTLVRSALNRFGGREVKHTGDGIMAVFPVVSQAVEAMAEVQRGIAAYNASSPENPLSVRIGINAGEPVVEENDYFGLAVTLAARICAEAGPGEILCSSVVRELTQGKTLFFRSRGETPLKGVSEPQRLYDVIWERDEEPADSGADSGETDPAPPPLSP
ncbi:adenylate/guanylate cyclase domain-containing protein [Pararhodospirillum oryzae]|uniref:Adenylate cyclase n=1 Tax=Pararhodospirillum oryzae TaxID=478448 RepID=A0A512H923_9PROT|nr:adenylate/guanylate cyclase domain-containing protein [Pararhodospirillum oryzae]GEO81932.1 adenylate cyclase [Pararhodospirillum oryzae]